MAYTGNHYREKERGENFMKIAYIAPADSAHTKKFCNYFSSHGHEVHVISFTEGIISNSEVKVIKTGASSNDNDLNKLKYITAAKKIKQEIINIKPEIIHAHYASSYGGIMALTGIKNYILSVWGSDVYDFPRKSFFHRKWLEFALNRAEILCSTSNVMAKEAGKYTRKKFYITPFGVDMNLFSPDKRKKLYNNDEFIIGLVKTLEPKYGIEYLIRAAGIIKNERPEINLKVRIAGKGSLEEYLKNLTASLGLDDSISFLGYISQQEAADVLAQMDISVIPSESESEFFGVSAVEAQSCGTALIISDIPGLMEASSPGFSSIVVPRKNPEAIAEAVIKLYDNENLRLSLGRNGREFVKQHYEYNQCFRKIENIYDEFLQSVKK